MKQLQLKPHTAFITIVYSVGITLIASTMAQAKPKNGLIISIEQSSQSSGSLNSALQSMEYTSVSIDGDGDSQLWSLGYRNQFSPRWSIDILYMQQGETKPQIQATLPQGKTVTEAAQDAAEAMPERGKGVSAIALYHYPLRKKNISLQAGIGVFAWRSERTAIIGGSGYTANSDGVSPLVQLGVSYPLTSRISVETNWRHSFMPDEDVDTVGLGVIASF